MFSPSKDNLSLSDFNRTEFWGKSMGNTTLKKMLLTQENLVVRSVLKRETSWHKKN